MNNIKDYIIRIENVLSDELCNQIINEYKNCNDWIDTKVGSGSINKTIRNCQTIGISTSNIINLNYDVRKNIDNQIFEKAAYCIKTYNEKFTHCQIEQDSGYDLLKYEENGFYTEHTDSFKAIPRSVSCSFALNDNFEGGEFAFFNQELKYKINKGDVLMFPSNFMYPHEIMPVKKGIRFSIVTWFI
jgi:predicted 2-oxoglutarate/Fe(II)-dependent dioxygenase YbiX